MPDRITTIRNYFETTLSAQMGPTDLSAQLVDNGGLVSPVILVIEPDDPAQREVILFDGTIVASTFNITTLTNRYLSGSGAGSGLTHPLGSVVRLAVVAQHLQDVNDRITAHDADVIHHDEAHIHDGLDGSGQVSHDVLTGVSADDHHTENHGARHALAGADPLPADSVAASQIQAGAVGTVEIADLAVLGTKIAAGAIDTTKLGDGAVTELKLGADAVTAAKIAANAVGTTELLDAAVTAAKLSGAVLADFVISGQTWVDNPADMNTATYTDKATVTYTRPAGWGSALIVAFGVINARLTAAAATLASARVEIGGSLGTGREHTVVQSDGDVAMINFHMVTTAVASATIAIATAVTGGLTTVVLEDAYIGFIAFRMS